MERIHITGLGPRTGTTLMAESMIACFAIDAFDDHEAQVFKLRRDSAVYLSKWPGDMVSGAGASGSTRIFTSSACCVIRATS